jgi:hypothetical protein
MGKQESVAARDRIIAILSDRGILYHVEFARLFDVQTGIFLSQLLYWHGRGRKGDWTYKTADEFENETGLTRKQQERCRLLLREAGVLDEEKHGIPAVLHFRLNLERLGELLGQLPDPEEGSENKEGNHVPPLRECELEEAEYVRSSNGGTYSIDYTETTTEMNSAPASPNIPPPLEVPQVSQAPVEKSPKATDALIEPVPKSKDALPPAALIGEVQPDLEANRIWMEYAERKRPPNRTQARLIAETVQTYGLEVFRQSCQWAAQKGMPLSDVARIASAARTFATKQTKSNGVPGTMVDDRAESADRARKLASRRVIDRVEAKQGKGWMDDVWAKLEAKGAITYSGGNPVQAGT